MPADEHWNTNEPMPADEHRNTNEPMPADEHRNTNEPMPADTRLKWAAAGWLIGTFVSLTSAVVLLNIFGDINLSNTDNNELGGASNLSDISIVKIFAFQLILWAVMIGTVILARRHGLDWPKQLGWRMRIADIPIGITIGIALQLVVLPLLYKPIFWFLKTRGSDEIGVEDVQKAAEDFINSANTPAEIALLVLMTVLLAPLVEEIFYRGLLQGALQDRFGPVVAIGGASFFFAIAHLLWLQFPALLIVGLVHGIMLWRLKRIGASVWSHMSFNAVTVIYLL